MIAKKSLEGRDLADILDKKCLNALKSTTGIPNEIKLPDREVVRDLALRLKSLTADVRLEILFMLSQTSLPVCTLAALIGRDQSLVSNHLANLRMAGLVRERRRGKYVVYSLERERVDEIMEALSELFHGGA